MYVDPVERFAEELDEEVARRLGRDHSYRRDVVTQMVGEYLIEDGTLEELHTVYCSKRLRRSHAQANGYAISGHGHVLDLVITDEGHGAGTVPPARSRQHFAKARNFLEFCRDGHFELMETSTAEYDMAQSIHANWSDFDKIRIFLITEGRSSLGNPPDDVFGEVAVTHHMWDIQRIDRLVSSGRMEESITIDLEEFGGPLPCLQVPVSHSEYQCLMTSIPGAMLAELYDKHGSKLLQRNVRAFLQNKSKVNKEIGRTVRENPKRFLAYNNGISATATQVTLSESEGRSSILTLHNLQIVNGGQTTASLHHSSKRAKQSLDEIQVPAKITVVSENLLDELVPRISRYANSQNPINTADFESNSPFHVTLERYSRSVWAPVVGTSNSQTRWYYERVRGQYEVDERRHGSAGAFSKEFPKHQRITKTDVAKYEMTFLRRPHLASLGAQKCFARWTEDVLGSKPDGWTPDEGDFRDLIAKRILFEQVRATIRSRRHGAGYLMQVTTHTLARMTSELDLASVLNEIWKRQSVPDELLEEAFLLSERVREVLLAAPGSGNVSEWAKKEECWNSVRELVWERSA